MNLEYYISRRIRSSKLYKNSVSAPIIKISIAAVAIGLIVMLIAIGTGVGLQRKIKEKVGAFNGHISITKYDRNNSLTSVRPLEITQQFYPDYSSYPEVKYMQPVATKGGIIRLSDGFEGIIMKGVDSAYRWEPMRKFLIEGRLPLLDYTKNNGSREIIISHMLASRLNLKVGNKAPTYFIKPNGEPVGRGFSIVGIFDSGLEEYDEKFIIGDLRIIQKINGWNPDQAGNFEVFLESIEHMDIVGEQIYNEIPTDLDAQTLEQQFPTIFQWLDLLDTNIYGIIAIILVVSIINMITALLVLILERTQMIGLLKALGSSNWSIRKIFLYSAGNIILRGIIIGNMVGLGLLAIQHFISPFTLDPETYYVNTAPVSIDLSHVLLLNAGTLLICLVVLIVPSYIVSKISPVQAMRFE